MPLVALPAWDSRGVLPPCNSVSPTSADRSPYRVSLYDVVMGFALTADRMKILQGLLRYRAALHAVGLVDGFQWLDGSFCEHIEMLELRPPGDIDVVTFHVMPQGQTQTTLKLAAPSLFPINPAERVALKATYHVDAYTQSLGTKPEILVSRSVYWYSVWSHRRDQTWKGYVEVDLAPVDDAVVLAALMALPTQAPTLNMAAAPTAAPQAQP